jgi:hypothetical protein
VLPLVASVAYESREVRDFIFRTVSQTMLAYRDSPVSSGRAGAVHGGDRLPWVRTHDNYASLRRIGWQVHVYGSARPELQAWCAQRAVPLQVFDWQEAYGRAGLARDAAYLLRPDTYVACADPGGAASVLDAYVIAHGLTVGTGSPP